MAILKHLLSEATPEQLERLLLDVLPIRYAHLQDDDPFTDVRAVLERLSKAYRIVFEAASEDLKRKVLQQFVRILREEDGDVVSMYSSAFFRTSDLRYVRPEHQPMVRQHILARVPAVHNAVSFLTVHGIVPYLDIEDVQAWLDPLVRAIISPNTSDSLRARIREYHEDVAADATSEIEKAIDKRLANWINHLNTSNPDKASLVEALKNAIVANRLPF